MLVQVAKVLKLARVQEVGVEDEELVERRGKDYIGEE